LSGFLREYDKVHRPAVEGDEAGGFVEAGGRDVADIYGELEARDVRAGKLQGMCKSSAAETAAAGSWGQTKVNDFPDVAAGNIREEQYDSGLGLAWYLPELPAGRNEPPGGSMALDDVVK
jgi:hypothetical protein